MPLTTRCRAKLCDAPVPCLIHMVVERPVLWTDSDPQPALLELNVGDRFSATVDSIPGVPGRRLPGPVVASMNLHLVVTKLADAEGPLEAVDVQYWALRMAGLDHAESIDGLRQIDLDEIAPGGPPSVRAERARTILRDAGLLAAHRCRVCGTTWDADVDECPEIAKHPAEVSQ